MKSPEFASHWARELGSSEESLVQLRGGINNHVFRCGTNGHHWVIKGYAKHQPGQRDRMQAEVEFLRYAQLVAPLHVPALISVDWDRRCVVLEHIQGEAYPEGIRATTEDVRMAASFFRQLNSELNLAKQMITLDAAEAFLSLRQHLANVRERVDVLATDHLPPEFKSQAAKLIAEIKARADRADATLEAEIASGKVDDVLERMILRVSPSDFGFHNAIRTSLGVKFIDFEFSGWDDPAKTYIDFLLQPKVNVKCRPNEFLKVFSKNEANRLQARCLSLLPVLELKWTCIALAVLNPERLSNIIKISTETKEAELVRKRLTTAEAILTGSASNKAHLLA